jgi:hypothetical protein
MRKSASTTTSGRIERPRGDDRSRSDSPRTTGPRRRIDRGEHLTRRVPASDARLQLPTARPWGPSRRSPGRATTRLPRTPPRPVASGPTSPLRRKKVTAGCSPKSKPKPTRCGAVRCPTTRFVAVSDSESDSSVDDLGKNRDWRDYLREEVRATSVLQRRTIRVGNRTAKLACDDPQPNPLPEGRASQTRLADSWFTVHGTVLILTDERTGRPLNRPDEPVPLRRGPAGRGRPGGRPGGVRACGGPCTSRR